MKPRYMAALQHGTPGRQSVDVCRNEDEAPVLVLCGEQLNRINKVTEDVKHILLDCDYGISLSMGHLRENSADKFTLTGLNDSLYS